MLGFLVGFAVQWIGTVLGEVIKKKN